MKLFSKLFKKNKKNNEWFYHISVWDVMDIIRQWCEEVHLNISQVMFKLDVHTNKDIDIVKIYTDEPGYLIGKAGCIIDKYRKKMLEVGSEYRLKYNIKYDIKIELNEVQTVMSKEEEISYFNSLSISGVI